MLYPQHDEQGAIVRDSCEMPSRVERTLSDLDRRRVGHGRVSLNLWTQIMKPGDFLAQIVDPGMAFLAFAVGEKDAAGKVTPELRAMLCAIAGQESGWQSRRQENGPARGWWQFEQGGALRLLMQGPASGSRLQAVCAMLCIPFVEPAIFEAIAWSDHLATAMARLLLWTDPAVLPPLGDERSAWAVYQRNWRPGRPRPETWAARYGDACREAAS